MARRGTQSSFFEADETPVHAPLAARMRPQTIEEFVGQHSVIGQGTILRRAIEADRPPSLILWGPPGSGKTTLAHLIASRTQAHVIALSAVSAGVADLRQAVAEAKVRQSSGQRTLLFIDEIHRFNKGQQDAILPHVESGLVLFVGATTENPSFEVNGALLSRCRVFRLERLTDDDLDAIVDRALTDADRGLGSLRLTLADDARRFLVDQANGDARIALNALELASGGAEAGSIIDRATIAGALAHRMLLHDKAGDAHYQLASALIKSIRGSDPDAAVYWLARLLEAGEDPLFVARRLVILAAEDVGLADPMALSVAVAAQQAAHFVGMPEGYLPLTQAALYLATAPKSNSTIVAYQAAAADVAATMNEPVPLYLRNAATGLLRSMGYGQGYQYAHDHRGEALHPHLPENLVGRRYYTPTAEGEEAAIKDRLGR